MKKLLLLLSLSVIIMITGCENKTEMELQTLLTEIETAYIPLRCESNYAYWEGTISGDAACFAKYAQTNMKISSFFSDTEMFAKLKAIKESGQVKDTLLQRQLNVIYNKYLGNQADKELLEKIIEKETALEQKYAGYRAMYKGELINDNKVEEILHSSTNSKDLEEVWKAHKGIGNIVADDIKEVVKLRNEVAKELGFDNYHSMALVMQGQNPEEINALIDEVDALTKDGFASLKSEMDAAFAKRYGIKANDLMPWHFQGRYFQEAPNLYPVDLDKYYKGKSLEKLTSDFYASIGLDVSKIMENSDLYPKEGKNQHAFCSDMDGEGDVRILCNISDNEQWMGTMLHEFGHGVYALGNDAAPLPYLLRDAASSFTTEAVAMIFGRLSRNPEWMKVSLGISEEEADAIAEDCQKASRLQQLVFSRWVQVVYRFEKAMYADPDQNLNSLWWDLVEQYQLLKRPQDRNEPDWATKIHIALYPCYYHNYQLGELFASQMHYYIVNNITKSGDFKNECYIGKPEVGLWMNEKVFAPGMKYEWNDMIERATGEKLTAKYYKMQYVD